MVCLVSRIHIFLASKVGNHTFHIICLIVSFAGLALAAGHTARAQVAVIAHRDVRENALDDSELLDVFTRDVRSWSDGTPIVLFDLKERGPTRETFYSHLGVRPSRMKSIWLKQLYAGEGQPPNALETQEEVVERVERTRGAVGYVRMEMVQDDNVKVLHVIPSQADEPSG